MDDNTKNDGKDEKRPGVDSWLEDVLDGRTASSTAENHQFVNDKGKHHNDNNIAIVHGESIQQHENNPKIPDVVAKKPAAKATLKPQQIATLPRRYQYDNEDSECSSSSLLKDISIAQGAQLAEPDKEEDNGGTSHTAEEVAATGVTALRRQPAASATAIPGAFATDHTGSIQNSPLTFSTLNPRLTPTITTPVATNSLVVANPVTDNPNNLPMAEEVGIPHNNEQQGSQQSSHDKIWLAAILTLILVVALVILLVALLANNNPEESNEDPIAINDNIQNSTVLPTATTTETSLSTREYFKSLLPNYTLAALNNPGSPQFQAFEWFLQDPALENHTATDSNATVDYVYPSWRIRQRMALAIFYFSTLGSVWSRNNDWLSYTHHECEWYTADTVPFEVSRRDLDASAFFVYFTEPVCYSNGTYQHLRLYSNNLHGSLPNEIGWLSSLRSMIILSNSIEGTVPSSIGLLQRMEAINWVSNKVTGSIPSELGMMTNLIGLGTYVNQMTGQLPSELANLSKLKEMIAGDNQYTGTIPTEYARLTDMVLWVLPQNQLEGSLPSQLQSMTALVRLALNSNMFTGTIPTFLGHAGNFTTLRLEDNRFHGTIPAELMQLQNMQLMSISNNDIKGPLPSEIGVLSGMAVLEAANASLNGTVPTELENLSGLTVLNLANNPFLSGSIPVGLCGIQALNFDCSKVLCGCNCSCTNT